MKGIALIVHVCTALITRRFTGNILISMNHGGVTGIKNMAISPLKEYQEALNPQG